MPPPAAASCKAATGQMACGAWSHVWRGGRHQSSGRRRASRSAAAETSAEWKGSKRWIIRASFHSIWQLESVFASSKHAKRAIAKEKRRRSTLEGLHESNMQSLLVNNISGSFIERSFRTREGRTRADTRFCDPCDPSVKTACYARARGVVCGWV